MMAGWALNKIGSWIWMSYMSTWRLLLPWVPTGGGLRGDMMRSIRVFNIYASIKSGAACKCRTTWMIWLKPVKITHAFSGTVCLLPLHHLYHSVSKISEYSRTSWFKSASTASQTELAITTRIVMLSKKGWRAMRCAHPSSLPCWWNKNDGLPLRAIVFTT